MPPPPPSSPSAITLILTLTTEYFYPYHHHYYHPYQSIIKTYLRYLVPHSLSPSVSFSNFQSFNLLHISSFLILCQIVNFIRTVRCAPCTTNREARLGKYLAGKKVR